jgi:hypothetical protein
MVIALAEQPRDSIQCDHSTNALNRAQNPSRSNCCLGPLHLFNLYEWASRNIDGSLVVSLAAWTPRRLHSRKKTCPPPKSLYVEAKILSTGAVYQGLSASIMLSLVAWLTRKILPEQVAIVSDDDVELITRPMLPCDFCVSRDVATHR